MPTTRRFLLAVATVSCVFVLLGLSIPPVHAQTQGRRPLLHAAKGALRDRPGRGPLPRRGRLARVQADALASADGATAASSVSLNLFDDVTLVADVERYERRGAGFLWHGRLEGFPAGHATFVSTNGVLAGTVFAEGMTYEVAYAGDGLYEIRELDPTAFPTDDPPGSLDMVPPVADAAGTPVADSAAQIDVLVVWTPAAEAAAGGASAMQSLVDLSVANANTAYANSGIATRLRLVHKTQVSYTESTISTDLSRLTMTSDGYMDSVHTLRNQYGADMVSLLGAGYASSGACGIGYLMGFVSTSFASSAFNVVDYSCAAGNLSFAHELGHNQGMHHDPANASGTPAYSYSYGYVDPSCAFRTVMAYGGCTRVTQFSSPSVAYGGRVTGTATQNNALTLNNTAATVANFRAAVSSCTYVLSATSYSAAIGGGSSTVGLTVTGCSWTATSNAAWVTITSGASGTGSGTVGFTVAANPNGTSRTATLTIGGQSFNVTQAGVPCTYTVTPTTTSVGSGGATSSATVSAPVGCGWSTASGAAWVSVTSGTSGSGAGSVAYTVAANGALMSRSTTLTVAGQPVAVQQAAAPDASPPSITSPAAMVAVAAADDFAVRVLQDRWDMNDRTDLGWFLYAADQPAANLSGVTYANGLFTATAATADPSVLLLETGTPVAARVGRTGSVYAIDADRYRRLNLRLCLTGAADGAIASNGELYWSRGTIYSDNSTPNAFFVYGGCTIYSLDLRTHSVGKMPVSPGLAQYEWTGTMRALRLDPTNTAGQGVTIDWASLTAVTDATTTKTIMWTSSGPVDIYLDNNNNGADGNLGLLSNDGVLAKSVSGGSYAFQMGGLPPGDYYVAISNAGSSTLAYSPGFYRVQAAPTIDVLSPSEEGSADDFATVQLGNPWDMADPADVERTANISVSSFTTATLQTLKGVSLASQPVLNGTATAGPADPILWMLWSGGRGKNYRIDTSRYRILTLEMGIAGARDAANGSIARLVWKRSDETLENVSDDIIINHRQGVNSLDKIVLDMGDRTVLPLEPGAGSPSHSGWTGLVDNFRVDPHEFSDARQFWARRVKLAAFERAAGSYVVRWRLAGVADPTTVVSLGFDTDATGFNGTTIATNLPYATDPDGSGVYTWNLSGVTSGTYYVYVQATTAGGVVLNQAYARWPITTVASLPAAPVIRLDRTLLRYAATGNGAMKTGPQDVGVTFAGGVTTWTASALAPCDFVKLTGATGTGPGVFSIYMENRTTYPSGAQFGCTVRVDAPGATNSPQFVNVEFKIYANGTTAPPFGYVDTPAEGATVAGAFAVTGWAMDDIQVSEISIWRDPVGGEVSPHPNGKIFIGTAVALEDARPDVEHLNPTLPLNYKAGWGILILSNMLPFGGNGIFGLHAYASDPEGHQVLLGSRHVVASNASSNKPFGTIDTPRLGETVSGVIYNFGWALTPQPYFIPQSGATIWVFIDGLPVGQPLYNQYRPDIATLFPGYANSDGAVGVFTVDTTTLTNGLHTIEWSVTDNAGHIEGIGSRFFRVRN